MKLLLCNRSYPQAELVLKKLLPEIEIVSCAAEELKNYLTGVDILLPSIARIDAEVIAAGKFGLIQQLGVGVDSVDVESATKAGVWVANVPGAGSGNAESVAELAILQMLTLARRIDAARKNLSEGVFFQPTGMAIWNKTVCIVGLGDIGRLLAMRLRPFGVRLLAVREHPEHGAPAETGVEEVFGTKDLHNAVSEADFVVLAIPETKSTHYLINETALAAMKKGSFLINVSRGGIVDTKALLAALESGHLAGAGLDVYEQEPYDHHHAIFKQNVVATPHIGGNTDESLKGVVKAIAENIKLYADGKEPKHLLNKPEKLRKDLQNAL